MVLIDGLFKGYILTKNKKAIEKFKGVKNLKTYDQVKDESEFAGILADNTVLVDVDNREDSDILFKIVQDNKLKCRVYETSRGRHFLFLNNNMIQKNCTDKNLFLGIKADIKLGINTSYSILKNNGTERKVVYDIDDYETVPKFLLPSNVKINFKDLEEGDGRNQTLFNYILTLQASNFTVDECRNCIKLINDYVITQPLSDNEIETILRDDAFQAEIFYKNKTFLFDKYANFIINKCNVKRINNRLHIYKDGIYIDGREEIERQMIKHLEMLNRAKRTEVLTYINLLVLDNSSLAPANYIPFRNGILDISTNELLEFNPNIIVRNKINFDYNSNAYDELMDKTLNKLACDDPSIRSLIEEMIGYCFYTRNELGIAFILTGDKSNGKSTMLSLISEVLGEKNISSLDLNELGEKFKTAELFNKLANIGDDISDEFIINPALFKKLTTGDRINVEKKGQDPFEFNNYSKLIFSANRIPRMKDKTGAVQRRLIIIPFNAKFSKDDADFDPYIKYKLKEPQRLEYLIKLGVEGLKRILTNKDFTKSEKVNQELKEYEKMNNPILLFFEDYEKDYFLTSETSEIYKNYTLFCSENNFQPLSKIEFGRNVCNYYNLTTKTKKINGKVYRIYDDKK